jgi:hypothetical protein
MFSGAESSLDQECTLVQVGTKNAFEKTPTHSSHSCFSPAEVREGRASLIPPARSLGYFSYLWEVAVPNGILSCIVVWIPAFEQRPFAHRPFAHQTFFLQVRKSVCFGYRNRKKVSFFWLLEPGPAQESNSHFCVITTSLHAFQSVVQCNPLFSEP